MTETDFLMQLSGKLTELKGVVSDEGLAAASEAVAQLAEVDQLDEQDARRYLILAVASTLTAQLICIEGLRSLSDALRAAGEEAPPVPDLPGFYL